MRWYLFLEKSYKRPKCLKNKPKVENIIELGQRIVHLQKMVEVASKQHFSDAHN